MSNSDELRVMCRNCQCPTDDHVEGKCLYGSTRLAPHYCGLCRKPPNVRCAHCYKSIIDHAGYKCLYHPRSYEALLCAKCNEPLEDYHHIGIVHATGHRYHVICMPAKLNESEYSVIRDNERR